MAANDLWTITVLDRNGAAVDNRMGWVDEAYDHVVEDGVHYLEFAADDVLADGHAELRGLNGEMVEVDLPLADGTQCNFVGKIVGVDRETGVMEIEGNPE